MPKTRPRAKKAQRQRSRKIKNNFSFKSATGACKKFYQQNSQIIAILALFSLIVLIFWLMHGKNVSIEKAAPMSIRHLVASISAQTQSIKINQEFSYTEDEVKKEAPVKIIIPSAKIETDVIEAAIVNGYWETATNSASFGLGSTYPQDPGNTVIFAHAKPGLFANLNQVKKGDKIYLFTALRWYQYQVVEIKVVHPNQVEVVSPTQDKTLTLYTCDGYGDAYRLVVIAKP